VTELTDLLRTRNSSDSNQTEGEGPADMSFFPDLVWTLRDFFLDLQANGHAITSDEYLENSLKLKQGNRASFWEKERKVPRIILFLIMQLSISFSIFPLQALLQNNSDYLIENELTGSILNSISLSY
jgi:hypothetical protein